MGWKEHVRVVQHTDSVLEDDTCIRQKVSLTPCVPLLSENFCLPKIGEESFGNGKEATCGRDGVVVDVIDGSRLDNTILWTLGL
jgi:hypothetical protein